MMFETSTVRMTFVHTEKKKKAETKEHDTKKGERKNIRKKEGWKGKICVVLCLHTWMATEETVR